MELQPSGRVTGVGIVFQHDRMIPAEKDGEGGGVVFRSPNKSCELTVPVSIWETLGCPERFIVNIAAQ